MFKRNVEEKVQVSAYKIGPKLTIYMTNKWGVTLLLVDEGLSNSSNGGHWGRWMRLFVCQIMEEFILHCWRTLNKMTDECLEV